MKNLTMLGLLAFLTLALYSCKKKEGTGPVVTEERDIKDFRSIDVRLLANVFVSIGDKYKVSLESNQNIIDATETSVKDGKLLLKVKDGESIGADALTVRITMPSIDLIAMEGAGSLDVSDPFTTDKLNIDIAGSGSIHLASVTAGRIEGKLTGSGEIKAKGSCSDSKYTLSGSGKLDCPLLASNNTEVQMGGSGEAKVNAVNFLKVDITGSGNVFYSGTPRVDSKITGAGKLEHL